MFLLCLTTCFPQDYPFLSRLLHAVPLLCTFCTAGVELVLDMHSPALAVVVLLLSVLPLITIVFHHGKRCVEPATVVLPIRIRDPSATVSSSTDMAVVSSSTEGVAEADRCNIC